MIWDKGNEKQFELVGNLSLNTGANFSEILIKGKEILVQAS